MKPEVVELYADAMDSLRERVQVSALDAADRQLLDQIMGSYVHLSALLREKNITIKRLRNEIFGPTSESTKAIFPKGPTNTLDSKQDPAKTIPATAESGVLPGHHPPKPEHPDTQPAPPAEHDRSCHTEASSP